MFKYWPQAQTVRYDREEGNTWNPPTKAPGYYGTNSRGILVIEQYEVEIVPNTVRIALCEDYSGWASDKLGCVVDILMRSRKNETEKWKEERISLPLEWLKLEEKDIPDSYLAAYQRAMSIL